MMTLLRQSRAFRPLWCRNFSAVASDQPFVELRQYDLHPAGIKFFLESSKETADLRKALLPLLGFFTCDTGGPLNRVTHFYYYKSMDERDKYRAALTTNKEWQDYLDTVRQCVTTQTSSIFLPTSSILEAANIPPIYDFQSPSPPLPPPSSSSSHSHSHSHGHSHGHSHDDEEEQEVVIPAMYELRQYQLNAGYDGVPRLVEAFKKGLPDKIAADKEGQLVFIGNTDVGTLNNVIELWRYPSAAACIRGRQAARKVEKWRETIAAVTPGVQTFTSSFLRPTVFSPMQ